MIDPHLYFCIFSDIRQSYEEIKVMETVTLATRKPRSQLYDDISE